MKDRIKEHCEAVILRSLILMKSFNIITQETLKEIMDILSNRKFQKITTKKELPVKTKQIFTGINLIKHEVK